MYNTGQNVQQLTKKQTNTKLLTISGSERKDWVPGIYAKWHTQSRNIPHCLQIKNTITVLSSKHIPGIYIQRNKNYCYTKIRKQMRKTLWLRYGNNENVYQCNWYTTTQLHEGKKKTTRSQTHPIHWKKPASKDCKPYEPIYMTLSKWQNYIDDRLVLAMD